MKTKYTVFNLLDRFKERLSKYITAYLDTRFIFVIDLALSFLASLFTVLTIEFMTETVYFTKPIAITWMLASIVFSAIAFYIMKCYRTAIRNTSLRDLPRGFYAVLMKVLLMALLLVCFTKINNVFIVALVLDFLFTMFFRIIVRFVMVFVYYYIIRRVNVKSNIVDVAVIGLPEKVAGVITRLSNSTHYNIVGVLSNNHSDRNVTIGGTKTYIYDTEKELNDIITELSVGAILFASENDARLNGELVEYCTEHKIKTLIIPSVDEMGDEKKRKLSKVRAVRIEDLLGREEIKLSMDEIERNFRGKIVMVTGAAGSIGSELCRQLATFGVRKLVLFDNNETPMHNLRLELEDTFPYLDFVPVIGDVRQKQRLDYVFSHFHPQVVFHAAAYKHVPLMEENPCEAILVNVMGSRSVAEHCVKFGTEAMVMISTDKAVNPTNIMGCSKRLAEIYVQSLGLSVEQGTYTDMTIDGQAPHTKFVTTRFGNVLGSNGSVIPRFRDQIENGGPVTVTHPDITRFFMTIPEACRLVMEAATLSHGNQIFVFDMGTSVKIADLAKRMIRLAGFEPGKDIEIKYTGLRPGEKLYEEVLAKKEDTLPTSHSRIRIANIREYEYDTIKGSIDELCRLAYDVNIPDMVKLMKKIVPEYKSNNSEFERFDR